MCLSSCHRRTHAWSERSRACSPHRVLCASALPVAPGSCIPQPPLAYPRLCQLSFSFSSSSLVTFLRSTPCPFLFPFPVPFPPSSFFNPPLCGYPSFFVLHLSSFLLSFLLPSSPFMQLSDMVDEMTNSEGSKTYPLNQISKQVSTG